MQLGLATEDLNRLWFERNTGQVVTAVQRRVQHPVIRFLAATLDGIVEGTGAVFKSKFMLPWYFSEETAAQKYIAQLQPQYVGDQCPHGDTIDHHRRRQVDRTYHSG